MWSYKLFRIGALFLALNGAAHLLGHLSNKGAVPLNTMESYRNEVMYGYKFNLMGNMRSQGDLFDGLSLAFTVSMLTAAALGFTLRVEKKPAIILAVSATAMLAISVVYWFAIPTVLLAGAAACYVGSAYLEKA